ncbi:MAG TPA: hypothetical protein ENI95_10445 [Chloroflexi bacterium]|nr:hypothetical protein [Chloroflexota bacterium]
MSKVVYRVDAGHLGVRVAVLLTMVLGSWLGLFVVMPAILSLLSLTGLPELCVSIVGGVGLGVLLSWLVERLLRRIWPSGRWLEVDDQQITLHERSGETVSINWQGRINVLSWYFVIRRGRALAPRGWYCLACRLNQEENIITPYTFVKPSVAETLPQWAAFEELISRKYAPRRGQEYQLKKVAEQGQLRNAEKDRWDEGAELLPEDFFALVAMLDARVSDWPPEVET